MAQSHAKKNRVAGDKRVALPERRTAVAYARVSSKDQEREGFSIPAQQRLLQLYAEQNNIDIIEEYVDIESAKSTGRTNYVRMVSWLKRNHKTCNMILVEKTDRLYRNIKDFVDLDAMDLVIHLVKEGTIFSKDARSTEKFMHGIRVLMAKNYIDNLSEESTKGMKEKARQGIWPTKSPLGYRNVEGSDGKKIMEIDPERAPIVQRLFEDAASGSYSLHALTERAREAGLRMKGTGGILRKASIHRILHNPLYTGEIHWHDEVHPGRHPPLVSRQLFDRVQDVLDGRNQNQREKERIHEFAFSGLIACGHCGCSLTAQIQKERYIYYHCTGHKGDCGEPYVREEVLSEQFLAGLESLHIDDAVMTLMRSSLRESQNDQATYHREAIERLEAECARLQKRIDQIYIDKLDGVIDTGFFERKSGEWREEQRAHRRAIMTHENANQSYIEEGIALLELGSDACGLFALRAALEQRELLDFVVSNSQWSSGKLTITWKQPFDILEELAEATKNKTPSEIASEGVSSRLVTPRGLEPLLSG